jgi:lysozyme
MTMPPRLRVSRTGLDLIKGFEGFRENATRLSDGRWIVGYGHVKTAREGLTISEKDAEELLKADLRPVEDSILSLVFAPLRQNQFDALASFAFNISPMQFKDSEVLRAINAGDEIAAANAFDAWRRARINGRLIVVDALVRRRAEEKALFLAHPGGRPAAPSQVVTPEMDPSVGPAGRDARPIRPPEGPSAAGGGADVGAAIRTIVEKQAPPPQAPAPSPAATPTEAARVVTERIAQILEKGEKAHQERAGLQPAPAAAVPPPAPPTPRPQTRPQAAQRKLIDDTEVIDPGKDPQTLFEEAVRKEKSLKARTEAGRAGGAWSIAPWLGFLLMSIVGLAVSMTFALNDRTSEVAAPGPLAGAAVFALLAVISIYFIASRGPGRRT